MAFEIEKEKILGLDKHYVEKLIPAIDRVNFMYFNNSAHKRLDFFMFALALGVNEGKRTPSHPGIGIIRQGQINSMDMELTYLTAVALEELRKTGEENKITDISTVFNIAEEYANTGCAIIEEMIPDFSSYDESTFLYSMVERLNTRYDEIDNLN